MKVEKHSTKLIRGLCVSSAFVTIVREDVHRADVNRLGEKKRKSTKADEEK